MKEIAYIGVYAILIGLLATALGLNVRVEPLKFFVFIFVTNGIVALLRGEMHK